jgi:hypothetical protein
MGRRNVSAATSIIAAGMRGANKKPTRGRGAGVPIFRKSKPVLRFRLANLFGVFLTLDFSGFQRAERDELLVHA